MGVNAKCVPLSSWPLMATPVIPFLRSRNDALSASLSTGSVKFTTIGVPTLTLVAALAGSTEAMAGGMVSTVVMMLTSGRVSPGRTRSVSRSAGSSRLVSTRVHHSGRKLVWAMSIRRWLMWSGVSGKPPTLPSSGVIRTE